MRYTYTHFPNGAITERIVDLFTQMPIRQFATYVENGLLIIPKNRMDFAIQELSYKNLRWTLLDDYAAACGVSLKYIIYGNNYPEKTYYSDFDEEVLALLNAMDPQILHSSVAVLKAAYTNPRFEIAQETPPSSKIMAIRLFNTFPEVVPENELDRYMTDINDELNRFRKYPRKVDFIFHLDYILDMCTYYHVSPHWVFSLKGPLLCNTAEADEWFDLFCLTSHRQQIELLTMLYMIWQQSEEKDGTLSEDMIARIEKIIGEGEGQ